MTAPSFAGPGRSGPDIRAALAEHAPSEVKAFELEFHEALAEAAATFDLGVVDQVLARWWRTAVIRSTHLTDAEQHQVQRAKAGDFAGLIEQTNDGSFRRLG